MTPSCRHELQLCSGRDAAGKASRWCQQLVEQYAVPFETAHALDVSLVEMMANLHDHAYQGADGQIRLALEFQDNQVVLALEDEGPAFNPLQQAAPVMSRTLAEASIGGLGIHLIRQLVSHWDYCRIGCTNHLTLFFDLHATNATQA